MVIAVSCGNRALHQERLGAQRLPSHQLLEPCQRMLVRRAAVRSRLANVPHDGCGQDIGVARPQSFLGFGGSAAEIDDRSPRNLRRCDGHEQCANCDTPGLSQRPLTFQFLQ